MMRQRPVAQKKLDEVDQIKKLASQYHVIGLANLSKIPASALQELRQGLRKDVTIRMAKRRIIVRAFEALNLPNLKEFATQITGISACLFTNMNPIKLVKYLDSKASKGPAKPGDLAPIDIIIPEGDTKLPPGPVVSEFSQHLKIQTMVKNGTVHIRTEMMTHKIGDVITGKQAELLNKLGITPNEIKMDLYAAWDNGSIIPSEVLHVNDAKIVEDVRLAASQAFNIAMKIDFVTKETIQPMIVKAARIAEKIALDLPIVIPELVEKYVAKAVREAKSVEKIVPGLDNKTE